MTTIVKRRGHQEDFDERKVYASCYAACLNAHLMEEEAEKISEQVASQLKKWIEKQGQVTSAEIFLEVARLMKECNQHAGFMYETHRDLS